MSITKTKKTIDLDLSLEDVSELWFTVPTIATLRKGRMRRTVGPGPIGPALKLTEGTEVHLEPYETPTHWKARPVSCLWSDGVQRKPEDIIIIERSDVIPLPLWVWSSGDIDAHHPVDRCGGPYKLSDVINECGGARFYLFSVQDCAFAITDVVLADSWEEAYEEYIDWAACHRGIGIDKKDYGDYGISEENWDSATCSFTSNGTPVDTEAIQGHEVTLYKVVRST